MKRSLLILLISFLTLISFGQTKIEIKQVDIDYRSSFGDSRNYMIDLDARRIDYTTGIIPLNPDGSPIFNSKRISKKSFNELSRLIDSVGFMSLDSTTGYGLDGAWYKINVGFSNGCTKRYDLWSGYAPEPLNELFAYLRKKYK